jgi:hypothetical protein
MGFKHTALENVVSGQGALHTINTDLLPNDECREAVFALGDAFERAIAVLEKHEAQLVAE